MQDIINFLEENYWKEKLNSLLLEMIKKLGLIKVGDNIDLDFDHQFIPAHKYDSKYSYKGDYGYFPGWEQ